MCIVIPRLCVLFICRHGVPAAALSVMHVWNGFQRTVPSRNPSCPTRQSTSHPRSNLAYGEGEARATPRSHFPSSSFGSRSSCSQRRPEGVAGMQIPQEHGMASSCHVQNTLPPENRSDRLRHSASIKNFNQCLPVLTMRHCTDSTISTNRLGLYNQATACVSVPRIKH